MTHETSWQQHLPAGRRHRPWLTEASHKLGNTVIISGRRRSDHCQDAASEESATV
jgi:hypothetical protein